VSWLDHVELSSPLVSLLSRQVMGPSHQVEVDFWRGINPVCRSYTEALRRVVDSNHDKHKECKKKINHQGNRESSQAAIKSGGGRSSADESLG
jgi:hypothetical protein